MKTLAERLGGKVFLAWYHTGFTDDGNCLLDVCDSRETANECIEGHKRARNKDMEFKDEAHWWIDEQIIRTGVKVEQPKPSMDEGDMAANLNSTSKPAMVRCDHWQPECDDANLGCEEHNVPHKQGSNCSPDKCYVANAIVRCVPVEPEAK